MKQQVSLLLILLSWTLAHEGNDSSLTSLEEDLHIEESPRILPIPFGHRKSHRLQQIGGKPYPSPPHPPETEVQENTTTEGCLFQTTSSDLLTDGNLVSTEKPASSSPKPTKKRPKPTKKRPPPTPPPTHLEEEEERDSLVYSISRMDQDGGYFFEQEQGFFKTNPKKKGEKIHVKTGAYGFTSPEGARVRIDYVADENGYRAFDTT